MIQRKTFASPPKRVALFVTCMVDMIYPEVGMSTAELLERLGVEVVFPYEQTCCGQPAFNAGYRNEASALARRYLDVFEPLIKQGVVEAIVAPSGSCTTMTSHFYSALFEDAADQADRRRAEDLAAVTFELTEFLVDVLGITRTDSHFNGKIAYHACCHLLRELHVDKQPRTLLQNIDDADMVDMAGADECCGFGGLFSVKNSGISTAMGQRKCVNVAQSEADVVALCDVSCMTHINGLLSRQAQHARAVHIAELLNNQIDLAEESDQASDEPEHKPRRWQDI